MEVTNPHNQFVSIMKGIAQEAVDDIKKEIYYGLVISTNPLKIKTKEFIIDSTMIKYLESTSFLLRKKYKITCNNKQCSITHNIIENLEIGDEVLLIRIYDYFIYIDKVVS